MRAWEYSRTDNYEVAEKCNTKHLANQTNERVKVPGTGTKQRGRKEGHAKI